MVSNLTMFLVMMPVSAREVTAAESGEKSMTPAAARLPMILLHPPPAQNGRKSVSDGHRAWCDVVWWQSLSPGSLVPQTPLQVLRALNLREAVLSRVLPHPVQTHGRTDRQRLRSAALMRTKGNCRRT